MKNSLFNFFYDVCLLLLFLILSPWFLYQIIFKKKYRGNFLHRCGLPSFKIDKGNRPLIWIHAVSVGETKAVAALARQIKDQNPDALLLISSITETGQAEARRSIPFADHYIFLPFDFHFIVAPLVKRLSPNLVLLSETDYWYNFIKCVKKVGGKLVVVNAKMSERSLKRYGLFKPFSERLFSPFDLFCVQNELYKQRLIAAGIPADKCVVTGNLKLDGQGGARIQTPEQVEKLQQLRKLLGIVADDMVITIGSTHDPEEKWLLDSLLKRLAGKVKIIIAPRHPERCNAVSALLEKEGIHYGRYTQLSKSPNEETGAKVILIDVIGLLTQCYQLSHLAIVGGSYVSHVGGHNILEPCEYGIPSLFGPHMHTQTEFVDLIRNYQAGKQLPLERLCDEAERLLHNEEARKEMGARGLKLIQESRGATAKTLKHLQLPNSKKPHK